MPFESLPVGPDVRVERDPLAKNERYWLRESSGDWLRMAARDARASTPEWELVAVKAWQCREKVWSLLGSIGLAASKNQTYRLPAALGAEAKDVEHLADVEGVAAFPKGGGATAETLRALFSTQNFRPLPGAVFVENASIPQELMRNDVLLSHRDVLRAIEPYGRVVGEYGSPSPTRMCYAIRQVHGGHEESLLALGLRDAEFLASYVAMQSELYLLQKAIAGRVGLEKTHFFLEGLSSVRAENDHSLIKGPAGTYYLSNVEEMLDVHGGGELPTRIADRILAMARGGDVKGALAGLKLCVGGREFANCQLASGIDIESRIHGLNLPKNVERQLADDVHDLIHDGVQTPQSTHDRALDARMLSWFEWVNKRIADGMRDTVKKGETAIVVLGGAHFRSGTPAECSEVLDGKHVEDSFLRSEASKTSRLCVIEPRNYTIHKQRDPF